MRRKIDKAAVAFMRGCCMRERSVCGLQRQDKHVTESTVNNSAKWSFVSYFNRTISDVSS